MIDDEKIRELGRLKLIEETKIDLVKLRHQIQEDMLYIIARIDSTMENIMKLQTNGCNKIQEIQKGDKNAKRR
jgi:hypothetical protein